MVCCVCMYVCVGVGFDEYVFVCLCVSVCVYCTMGALLMAVLNLYEYSVWCLVSVFCILLALFT